jgi:hypothetical protein
LLWNMGLPSIVTSGREPFGEDFVSCDSFKKT